MVYVWAARIVHHLRICTVQRRAPLARHNHILYKHNMQIMTFVDYNTNDKQ